MSIGQVLEALITEFPAVSISKLRYLEEQSLVQPARTPSGYRKYSAADVERLRFILSSQRDHFWPLKVIRAKLEALDAGALTAEGGTVLEAPRPRALGGAPAGLEELATLSGATAQFVAEVAREAGAQPGAGGSADTALLQAVEAAAELAGHGLELRHLRGVFQAAARQADLVESAAAAQRGRGSAGRERAAAHAHELAEVVAGLYQAALRLALAGREG
jgi:DNA-binding transcriptional MerR regulator